MERFLAAVIATLAVFALFPVIVALAPDESTMGLVQKIFYVHVPCWWAMGAGVAVCGIASLIFLFQSEPMALHVAASTAELSALFGLCGLVTGPLWARKAWGHWWEWDAKLTIALLLEVIVISQILIRKYGGPGSDKLASAVGVASLAVTPFVYEAVTIWRRTIHPSTSVVPSLGPGMFGAFWLGSLAFLLLFGLLLAIRVRLEEQQTLLDELYLAREGA